MILILVNDEIAASRMEIGVVGINVFAGCEHALVEHENSLSVFAQLCII
jgi:hypothetical protein